ncbi:MAG: NifB/NifX family molybdenum-iron cluster-binding protein [Thermoanaerobacteraceae bacterium]|nr:NifB/NifX family molybdenum-iron cluster-binding protein [Thermoanaerobacteraceae bacterium]
MRVAISSTGTDIDSIVDERFGRARYFIIVDTETGEHEAIDNEAYQLSGGAGAKTAQMIIEKGSEAVISSNIGPNAMDVMEKAGIRVYRAYNMSVKEAVDLFNKGLLQEILQPTSKGHHGGI